MLTSCLIVTLLTFMTVIPRRMDEMDVCMGGIENVPPYNVLLASIAVSLEQFSSSVLPELTSFKSQKRFHF